MEQLQHEEDDNVNIGSDDHMYYDDDNDEEEEGKEEEDPGTTTMEEQAAAAAEVVVMEGTAHYQDHQNPQRAAEEAAALDWEVTDESGKQVQERFLQFLGTL